MGVKYLPGGAMQWTAGDDQDEYEITDKNGNRASHFRDKSQVVQMMKNPLYKQSAAYRAEVQRLLAGSPHIEMAEHNSESKVVREDLVNRGKARAMMHDKIREMFNDPRYKTSETYRQEVAAYIKENGWLHDELNRDSVINNLLADGQRRQCSVDTGGMTGPLSPTQMKEEQGGDDEESK